MFIFVRALTINTFFKKLLRLPYSIAIDSPSDGIISNRIALFPTRFSLNSIFQLVVSAEPGNITEKIRVKKGYTNQNSGPDEIAKFDAIMMSIRAAQSSYKVFSDLLRKQ